MTPEAALDIKISRYREMTVERRVLTALRLHELASAMCRAVSRRQYPEASDAHLVCLGHQRLELVLRER